MLVGHTCLEVVSKNHVACCKKSTPSSAPGQISDSNSQPKRSRRSPGVPAQLGRGAECDGNRGALDRGKSCYLALPSVHAGFREEKYQREAMKYEAD